MGNREYSRYSPSFINSDSLDRAPDTTDSGDSSTSMYSKNPQRLYLAIKKTKIKKESAAKSVIHCPGDWSSFLLHLCSTLLYSTLLDTPVLTPTYSTTVHTNVYSQSPMMQALSPPGHRRYRIGNEDAKAIETGETCGESPKGQVTIWGSNL